MHADWRIEVYADVNNLYTAKVKVVYNIGRIA